MWRALRTGLIVMRRDWLLNLGPFRTASTSPEVDSQSPHCGWSVMWHRGRPTSPGQVDGAASGPPVVRSCGLQGPNALARQRIGTGLRRRKPPEAKNCRPGAPQRSKTSEKLFPERERCTSQQRTPWRPAPPSPPPRGSSFAFSVSLRAMRCLSICELLAFAASCAWPAGVMTSCRARAWWAAWFVGRPGFQPPVTDGLRPGRWTRSLQQGLQLLQKTQPLSASGEQVGGTSSCSTSGVTHLTSDNTTTNLPLPVFSQAASAARAPQEEAGWTSSVTALAAGELLPAAAAPAAHAPAALVPPAPVASSSHAALKPAHVAPAPLAARRLLQKGKGGGNPKSTNGGTGNRPKGGAGREMQP